MEFIQIATDYLETALIVSLIFVILAILDAYLFNFWIGSSLLYLVHLFKKLTKTIKNVGK